MKEWTPSTALQKEPVAGRPDDNVDVVFGGIPPFAGFLGKYYIFSEAVKNGYMTLTIIAVLNSIVGVYYYFKVILAMYTKEANDVSVTPSLVYWIVILVCFTGSLLLGVYPGALTSLLN